MTCARREAGAHRPAPSAESPRKPDARPGRRRARLFRLLPALALLLGALSPFAAAPAAADVLVSNFGQTKANFGFATSGGAHSQPFTTGSAGEYTLSSIEVSLLTNANNAQRQTIRAELWSATTSGAPKAKLVSLTVPSSVSAGTVSFAAPANTKLAASTIYHLVLYTTTNFGIEIEHTATDNEDSGGAAGWSIGNRWYHDGNTPTGTWVSRSSNYLLIRVNGSAPATTTPTGTVWSATLTVADMGSLFGLGCGASGVPSAACSNASVLNPSNSFTLGGIANAVSTVWLLSGSLYFSYSGDENTALSSLNFCVGSTAFALSGLTAQGASWQNSGLSWSAGDTVELSIGTTCPTVTTPTTPDAPTFDPAHHTVLNDPTSNITLTFTKAIKSDASNTDFTNSSIDNILTLKKHNSAGDDIAFDATIDSAKKVITINPTSNLPEANVYVAISDAWYDADGNQGEAASATFQMLYLRPAPTFSPENGDTVTDASGNITVTFTEAIKADASNTDFTNSSIDNILTLKVGSASGANIAFDATIDSGKTVVTIDPTADLPAGKVYVAISNGFYNAAGIQGAAESHLFTVDPSSTAPTGLSVAAGNAQLTASWTAPSGVDVARYEAQIKLKSAASWPTGDTDVTGTSHTFTGLTNGSPYQVRVRTVETGEGVASAWSAPVEGTPAAPVVAPSVPQNVQVTPGDGKLTMSWEAPASWGTWPAKGYVVMWKLSSASSTAWAFVRKGGQVANFDAAATSFVFTGQQESASTSQPVTVTNGTAYDLRILAHTQRPGTDGSTDPADGRQSGWVAVTNTVPAAAQAPPTVTLSVSPNPVLEGSSTTVTATLSRALSSNVIIPLTVTAGSAESGDYTTGNNIPVVAGTLGSYIAFNAIQDSDEDDETVTVALGTLPSTVTAGTPSSLEITITDDDRFRLSVDTSHPTPACSAAVTDLAVRPETGLRLTPPPTGATETQVRIRASYGPAEGWRASLPIRRYDRLPTYGHSGFIRGITFAELRKNFPGFTGFEYRLKETPAITAQCTWQFDDEGGGGTGTDARLRNLQMNSGN